MDLDVGSGSAYEQHSETFATPHDVEMLHDFLVVYRSKPGREPEMMLMMAVLEDAIRCFIKYCSATNRGGKRRFKETKDWFFDSKDDRLFSFESLCGTFALDPGYIRRGLLQYERDHSFIVHLPQRRISITVPRSDLRLAS
jgi:hypothetical protein